MKLLLKRKGVAELFLLHIHGGGFASSQIFTLNLQTTMLHRAHAGGVLEAGLEDTLTTERTMLLQQRLGKKRGLRKPEPNVRHLILLHPRRRTRARDFSNECHSPTFPCSYNLGGQRSISSNQPPPQPWASLVTLPCLKIKIALHRCLLRL